MDGVESCVELPLQHLEGRGPSRAEGQLRRDHEKATADAAAMPDVGVTHAASATPAVLFAAATPAQGAVAASCQARAQWWPPHGGR